MISETHNLRKQYGRFEFISVSSDASVNHHQNTCQACGSDKPEQLFAVHPVKGGGVWFVGSTCAGILTRAEKLPSNVQAGDTWTSDDGKEWIVPNTSWCAATLENARMYGGVNLSGVSAGTQRVYIRDQFLDSVYCFYEKFGKISVKQYEATKKALAKKGIIIE